MINREVCAGIITYNPNKRQLILNLNKMQEQVVEIIIVDNGSSNYDEWAEELPETVYLIRNEENRGVAAALNQMCKIALNRKYSWCLTLDQDSLCPSNLITELFKCVDEKVAIVAPDIIYNNNEFFTSEKSGIESVDWVITSASLTNLKVWKEIKFDEKLFIDGVDKDFCIRARKNNYQIIKNYNIRIIHELGALKCRKILGRIVYVTNHPAFRVYFMVRNAYYLDKKLYLKTAKIKTLKIFLKILFFEKNKMEKFKSIRCGIVDGRKMVKNKI